ncbi:phosphoglycolate phosphatase [Rubrimonas sp.]|uniref:phosphoglycolate phosphatase n=1 Tax=Rubrimonas sp. TaxID=2036015 RepID=UPI002FDCB36F
MSAVKLVVFDLDGTLVDSAPAIQKIARIMLEELGAEPLDLAETRSFIGHGAAKLVERALAARGLTADAVQLAAHVERFEELYAEAPGADNAPFPGAEAAMLALKAAGFRLGLCTNKPMAPTLNLLDALGWGGMFDAVAAGDSLPVRKPDPAMPRLVLEKVGATGALYVGDSETDVETARGAGLTMALYAHGYRKTPLEQMDADFVFDHFDALAPWVLTRSAA